jgi:hypothetical protein
MIIDMCRSLLSRDHAVDLPNPAPVDIDPDRAESSHWECRFCGAQERRSLTLEAEIWRELAHEARCAGRPAGGMRSGVELRAVDIVWRPALCGWIQGAWMAIEEQWSAYDRIPRCVRWMFLWRTRRRVERVREQAYRLRTVGDVLGLPMGWASDLDRVEPVR